MIEINTVFGLEKVETKLCRDCNIEKPIDEFAINRKFYDKSSPDGYRAVRRPTCKDCRSKKKPIDGFAKNFYSKRPATLECPICKDVVDGKYARLDHCHSTGRIRGWLCDNCNTALGKFKDSDEVLQRAIDWLKK